MVLCFAGSWWSLMGGGRTWRFDFTDNKLERSPTFSVSIPLLLPRGTPLYKPHRYVLPQGRGFALFWSKNGYRLCPFRSEIR